MRPNSTLAAAGLALMALVLTGCHHKKTSYSARRPAPPPVTTTTRTTPIPAPLPAPPVEDTTPQYSGKVYSSEVGLSSWYGPSFHGHNAANGLPYDQNAMTAAHRTLPMGTVVRVTNLQTGLSAIVTITDRGPFVHGRVLDLSMAAAKQTGVYRAGVARVKIDVLKQTPNSSVSGKWCVQVGAFANPKNSLNLKAQMIRRYQTAKVIEFPGPTGHWVRINPAGLDKQHASEVLSSIRPAEPDAEAYLVRLD